MTFTIPLPTKSFQFPFPTIPMIAPYSYFFPDTAIHNSSLSHMHYFEITKAEKSILNYWNIFTTFSQCLILDVTMVLGP